MTDEVNNEKTKDTEVVTEQNEIREFQVFEKTQPTRQFIEDNNEYLTTVYYDLLSLVEGVAELVGAGFKLSIEKSKHYPFVLNGTQFYLTFERELKRLAKQQAIDIDKSTVPSLLGNTEKESAKQSEKEVSTSVETSEKEENTEVKPKRGRKPAVK